jgi:hypothetical protein
MKVGKLLLVCAALATTGCRGVVNPFFTANEFEVSIGKNTFNSQFDTFGIASEHCRKYGKLAVLERVGRPSDLMTGHIDKYRCEKA